MHSMQAMRPNSMSTGAKSAILDCLV